MITYFYFPIDSRYEEARRLESGCSTYFFTGSDYAFKKMLIDTMWIWMEFLLFYFCYLYFINFTINQCLILCTLLVHFTIPSPYLICCILQGVKQFRCCTLLTQTHWMHLIFYLKLIKRQASCNITKRYITLLF